MAIVMTMTGAIASGRDVSGPAEPVVPQDVAPVKQPHTIEDLIRLGQSYRKGLDGVRDEAKALRWFREAAARDSGEGHRWVGFLLEFGTMVPRDYPGARQAYARSVELGSTSGLVAEGQLLRSGKLGAPDFAAARASFERAVERGAGLACYELGWMEELGQGAPVDPAKAFGWFERGARQEHGPSQYRLGWMLREGHGVAADDERAVNWLRLALKNDEPLAHANLAFHFLTGRGVARDLVLAWEQAWLGVEHSGDPSLRRRLLPEIFYRANNEERTALRTALKERLARCEPGASPESVIVDWMLTGPVEGREPELAMPRLRAGLAREKGWAFEVAAQLAWLGQMPGEPVESATTYARRLQELEPARSGGWSARYDYFAAANPAARTEAYGRLMQLADASNPTALQTLIEIYALGLGKPRDLVKARWWMQAAAVAGDEKARVHLAKGRSPRALFIDYFQLSPSALADDRAEPAPPVTMPILRDSPPRVYFQSAPDFPPDLHAAEFTGQAKVGFVVDSHGRPVSVQATGADHPLFALAAEAAVRRWRFLPGTKDGKAVNTRLQVPIEFSIADDIEEAKKVKAVQGGAGGPP